MKMHLLAACVCLTSLSMGHAQINITFRSQQDIHGSAYANIWGYVDSLGNEYALVGCQTGIAVVNVSDPDNPSEVAYIPAATSSWHEIQVWGPYAYSTSENGSSVSPLSGLQVIYLGALPDTAYLVNTYTTTFHRAHDLQIRDGYAYITGATNSTHAPHGGVIILDLADPVHPVEVGVWDSIYVHDCFVRRDTIYAANLSSGWAMISAANKENPKAIYVQTYPNNFTHNAALTDDGQYLLTTDEAYPPNFPYPGRMRIWDISTLRDGIPGNTNVDTVYEFGGTAIVHNVFALGNLAYASYYTQGVRVWDITDPDHASLVGSYDTYPGNDNATFNGAWGVYPFFGSGTLVVSNIEDGLFVLTYDQAQKGYIRGVVTDSVTGAPVPGVRVTFLETNLSCLTDNDGAYRFPALAGHYTLRTDRADYRRRIIATAVGLNDTTALDFTITPNTIVGTGEGQGRITDFRLEQNFPNPFNPATTIRYTVPAAVPVSLVIHNVLGHAVRTLVDGRTQMGPQTVLWDGRDDAGNAVPSGVYVYRLKAGRAVQSRKMLLMK